MQVLIMMGPHSRVRSIQLSIGRLIIGALALLGILFFITWSISGLANQTRNALFSMERNAFLETRFIAQSEGDYETKLMQLQLRMDEAQRNLSQLDDLRNQLLRTQGAGVVELGNQTQFGHAQGGPAHPSTVTINLGNQGEHYGARLDRTVHDSIALSARVNAMQSALTHTWEGSGLPTGLPLPGFIKPSSGLGYRIDPISGQLAWHEGTDYPAAHGTPIKATGDGVVVRAGWDTEYGNVVDIKHPNAVITRYAHAQALFVKVGDVVQQSQVIATVGSTGRSTGPHLHYEVIRNGQALVNR
jgi:murein DD-endopeptidase MepM/ murein hydrolase activator NlpD